MQNKKIFAKQIMYHKCKTKHIALQKWRFLQNKYVCVSQMQNKTHCFANFWLFAKQNALLYKYMAEKILFSGVKVYAS